MAEYVEFNKKKVIRIVIIAVVVIFILSFSGRMFTTIPAGHGGVIFRTFMGGVDQEKIYGEGLHVIAPWNKMVVYETRQQEIAETMNVLSSNGLEIAADISAWYEPIESDMPQLHSNIGTDYLRRVVIPAMRSSARSVIGRYTPEQIYSTARDAIQDEIYIETKKILDEKYVQLDRVLIRSVTLPTAIKDAIERKLKQEQESLEYEFRIQKAEKEAERQIIEAQGKARANDIINASLTDKILQEKGIEATVKLSESGNSKVVVIGNNKNGLPLILGDSK
ncbi:MAG: prohibitin family protein [Bacteroidales bacterium]|nr:prohibitin family protein [Bacteroidales bacterium]MDY0285287.1 prohibitin family protein [Bacteroidales bacterium]